MCQYSIPGLKLDSFLVKNYDNCFDENLSVVLGVKTLSQSVILVG